MILEDEIEEQEQDLFVKDFLQQNLYFSKVYLVDKNNRYGNWLAKPHVFTRADVLNNYGDCVCEYKPNLESPSRSVLNIFVDSDDEYLVADQAAINSFFGRK